ncbi:MAG: GNAT family N-acetyltransferase [Anaerolineales bacterium]
MTITYRKATADDSYAVFQVFSKSIIDLGERTNVMAITGGNHPEVLQSLWSHRKFLFEYLAESAAQFWVAEENGKIIGYARSIEHDGLMDLTEFFVLPEQQSAGVGRELMARAFPETDAQHRIIVATMDERALSRYLRAGVYARFPIKYFSRKAEKVTVETDLVIEPLQIDLHLNDLNRIDKQIIGHSRGNIHCWIATTRDGFVYKRNGEIVGYGYVGGGNGPFALLDETDYRAVLAHAELLMAEKGEEFGAETPFINKGAIQYFLERKYRIDLFTVLFMSNEPFGKFENYLCFSPIFFMRMLSHRDHRDL